MLTPLLALVLLAPGPPPSLAEAAATSAFCAVTVERDDRWPSYLAQVRTAPGCTGLARVRKHSTVNFKVISPSRGAWTVRPGETLNVWVFTYRVEYWDGAEWVEAPVFPWGGGFDTDQA